MWENMSYKLKTLLLVTLSPVFILSCSNEAAQIENPVATAEAPAEVLNKAVSEADIQAQAAKDRL